jgi:hypothetical protein
MNRTEAQQLIGHRVKAWTAANGVYVGELIRILTPPERPWRGVVRITGVVECAHSGDRSRRGFRPNPDPGTANCRRESPLAIAFAPSVGVFAAWPCRTAPLLNAWPADRGVL